MPYASHPALYQVVAEDDGRIVGHAAAYTRDLTVPGAIVPAAHVTLADSIGKKTTFLRELTRVLGLEGVEVVTGRAEELGQDKSRRERYDLATARAVAALPVLCEYLLPLVKSGGMMVAPKKGDISLELQHAATASPILGGGPPETRAFNLPGETGERLVVLVPKVKRTPPGYPRRVGLAKSRPLGT